MGSMLLAPYKNYNSMQSGAAGQQAELANDCLLGWKVVQTLPELVQRSSDWSGDEVVRSFSQCLPDPFKQCNDVHGLL